jgi:hypothetical protein
MNPGVQIEMPASFVNNAKMMKVDFAQAAQDWERVQTFLRNLFARS